MIKQQVNLPILQATALLEGGADFPLPQIVPIRQSFPGSSISDIAAAVRASCEKAGLRRRIKPGLRVALAVGSRGICKEAAIVRALIDYLQELGAKPTIIPAMGSHGGPSAAGQTELLAAYGISEATMNVPVLSSLAVKQLGHTANGLTAWYAEDALRFDATIVVNRVKPHTDFQGSIESGLMKMCAVGLGKHKGASYIHSLGFANLGEAIKQVARLILAEANILGGLAIVENAYKDVTKVDFILNEEMEEREAALLLEAKAMMPRLPLKHIDVLLVQQIGKDISGAMFDPNITGRRKIWGMPDLLEPKVSVMAALELTAASHGNAAGLSVADICSERLLREVDFAATYASLITATLPQHAHIPMFFARDDEILRVSAKIAHSQNPEQATICWIQNTADLRQLWVSANALPQLAQDGSVDVVGPARSLPVNPEGLLSWEQYPC